VAVVLYLTGVIPGRSGGGSEARPASPGYSRPTKAPRAAKEPDPTWTDAALTDLIRRDPRNADAYLDRARSYFEQKDYDRALADYEQAIQLTPDVADAYLGRGCVHFQKGENDLALADFSEAIRLDPEAADPYLYRGRSHAARQEYQDALTDFDRCIRLTQDYVEAYIGRGKVRRDLKDYERAQADFERAIRLQPEVAEGYNELAWMWATCAVAKLRNPALALEHAARACKLTDWKDPRYLATYAAANAAAGNFDKAVRWQKKALALPEGLFPQQLDDLRAGLKLYESHKPYRVE
jgi:tetratricopeptide (TPR) repeat protein